MPKEIEDQFVKDFKRVSKKGIEATKRWWLKVKATGANVRWEPKKPVAPQTFDADVEIVRNALQGRYTAILALLTPENAQKLGGFAPAAEDAFERIVERLKQ